MPSSSDQPVTSRRGFFWTGAERFDGPWGTTIRAPMYVEWEAPVEVKHSWPIVLIHGGGGQGLDWMGTPDGRAGWSTLLVQRGYEVYVVDRPGHGRSSFHPDVIGPMGAPFPLQAGEAIFRSPPEGPASHPTAHRTRSGRERATTTIRRSRPSSPPAGPCRPTSPCRRRSTSHAGPSCSTASGRRSSLRSRSAVRPGG